MRQRYLLLGFHQMFDFVQSASSKTLYRRFYIIGSNATRLSAFRYNRIIDTRTQILLNDFYNIDDLLNKYDGIPYNSAGKRL